MKILSMIPLLIVIFGLGIVIGMYVVTQIEKYIDKNIKKK
tara:strand:+ start:18 stop:137 length:120 start_codon:yes stop_codon:yes gene_type:complete